MEPSTFAEQLMFSTVLVETESAAERGIGTSFMFLHESKSGNSYYLVTNKHVVEGMYFGYLTFTIEKNGSPVIGRQQRIILDHFSDLWIGHPDPTVDVCVLPLDAILIDLRRRNIPLFFRAIPSRLIPSEEEYRNIDAIEEILFLGYPNGIYDSVNYTPIVRRGITATPVYQDYEGKPRFLVDASVFPGSSGSPVLLSNTQSYESRDGVMTIGNPRRYLLGIVAEVMIREEHGAFRFEPIPTSLEPTVTIPQMIDLGVVFKASTILETIEHHLARSASASDRKS